MMPPDGSGALIDQARAALRRLAEAAPSRDAAATALEELEAAWRRRPFTVGVAGEAAHARTRLLDAACGGGMLALDEGAPARAPIRVRRGDATRFRATRKGGASEEAELPAERTSRVGERRSQADAARAQVGEQELALLRVERTVPRLARQAPPWWAFWLWLIRWLVVRRASAQLAAWQLAKQELAASQRELAATEETVAAADRELQAARGRFFERLRLVCAGGEARDVQEIALEVEGGPLADEVEVIEMAGPAGAAQAGAASRTEVDLAVRAASHVEVAGADGAPPRVLGSPGEAAFGLSRLAVEARALRIARRAAEVLMAERVQLGDAVAQAEIALRNRIARIEGLHLPDADRFLPTQLARIDAQASASIHAVLEHAGVHLLSELERRAARWDAQLKDALSVEDLKALAAQIDEEGVAEYKRIADETRMLVMGGVGGSARDLLAEMFAELRRPELLGEHAVAPRKAPPLPPVAILPSLTDPARSRFAGDLSGAGQWIAGLFRSLDARRTELREKVHQRSERVRASADAELLEAEPALRGALLEVVASELSAAVERRVTWFAAERAKEQAAADAERAALQPLAEVLDDVRRQSRRLQELIGELAGTAAPPAVT